MYDVCIIGSGPAGYTAGIYAVRAGMKSIIFEGDNWGGQLITTTDIFNFPGFPDGINGYNLMFNMKEQCKNLGCELIEENITNLEYSDKKFILRYKDNVLESKTVIVATGATAKKLNLPHENVFWNHGISACAVCDGALPMFRNKPLTVIGGGDTACEEALFLSRFGSKINMLVRSDKMRASYNMKEKVLSNNKIQIYYNTEAIDVCGTTNDEKTRLSGLKIVNNVTKEHDYIETSGLFYAIGHEPNTGLVKHLIPIDETGYAISNNTVTNIPGLFVCGDAQDKIYRQAITASATGCMASLEAERYLSDMK